MRKLLFILTMAAILVSCDDMTSSYEMYDGPETIYSEKPDSTNTIPGRNRVLIQAEFITTPGITSITVEWDDTLAVFPVTGSYDTTMYTLMLEGIKEKSYILDITSQDAAGNSSVPLTEYCTAYGDVYEGNLQNIYTSEVIKYPDSVLISWTPARENMIGKSLTYMNTNGDEVVLLLPTDETMTRVLDMDPDAEFTHQAMFVPEEVCLDTFYAEAIMTDMSTIETRTPIVAAVISTEHWSIIDFSSEEAGTDRLAAYIIDGDGSTFWHNRWSSGGAEAAIPHHITVDMGQTIAIEEFQLARRQPSNKDAKTIDFQISTDNVNWQSAGGFTYGDENNHIYELDAPMNARYVKIVVTASNRDPSSSLSEFVVSGIPVASMLGQAGWSIVDFTTEEAGGEGPVNGYCTALIDNDVTTFWHSQWSSDPAPVLPHIITLDLGDDITIESLDLYRRKNNSNTKSVVFEVSTDGTTFVSVGGFTYESGDLFNYELEEPVSARYLKVKVTESNSIPHASLGELYVIGYYTAD